MGGFESGNCAPDSKPSRAITHRKGLGALDPNVNCVSAIVGTYDCKICKRVANAEVVLQSWSDLLKHMWNVHRRSYDPVTNRFHLKITRIGTREEAEDEFGCGVCGSRYATKEEAEECERTDRLY